MKINGIIDEMITRLRGGRGRGASEWKVRVKVKVKWDAKDERRVKAVHRVSEQHRSKRKAQIKHANARA